MEFNKAVLTLDELADRLEEAGMALDRAYAVERMKDVGYYRLSGYWHIFRESDGSFREGTGFGEVWALYVFDRQLRLVVLDAVERVEVYMRTQLVNELARRSGPFGYMNRAEFPRLTGEDYRKFLKHCKVEYRRSSESFVAHFKEKYGDCHEMPPYWMLANIMDFGSMFTMYRGAPVDVRNAIAAELGVTAKVLESWVMALNTTRNRCAHHARLWNRELGTRPKIPNEKSDSRWHEPYEVGSDRIFGVLTILSYLLERMAPDTKWRSRLFALLETIDGKHLSQMGFKEGWRECPFWAPWVTDGSYDAPAADLADNRGCLWPLGRFLGGADE